MMEVESRILSVLTDLIEYALSHFIPKNIETKNNLEYNDSDYFYEDWFNPIYNNGGLSVNVPILKLQSDVEPPVYIINDNGDEGLGLGFKTVNTVPSQKITIKSYYIVDDVEKSISKTVTLFQGSYVYTDLNSIITWDNLTKIYVNISSKTVENTKYKSKRIYYTKNTFNLISHDDFNEIMDNAINDN